MDFVDFVDAADAYVSQASTKYAPQALGVPKLSQLSTASGTTTQKRPRRFIDSSRSRFGAKIMNIQKDVWRQNPKGHLHSKLLIST